MFAEAEEAADTVSADAACCKAELSAAAGAVSEAALPERFALRQLHWSVLEWLRQFALERLLHQSVLERFLQIQLIDYRLVHILVRWFPRLLVEP